MDEKPATSSGRIAIWIVGGAVGLYLLVNGLIGILGR
jgi:hypothetical protein